MSDSFKLEGSLKRAYVRALRVRLVQAKRRDLMALLSASCPVCKEVVRIQKKEELKMAICDLCPIPETCHRFTAKRHILASLSLQKVASDWGGLVVWLEGLLEEACK